VNPELSEEAVEFGEVVKRAFESAGGDLLVQQAEQEPEKRAHLVEPVLDELGAWELEVSGSAEELEAAAAVCRSAGYWAVPYPVAERLGALVLGPQRRAAVGGIDREWLAVDLDGNRFTATARPLAVPPRKSAFVTDLDLTPVEGDGSADLVLGLVLPCWTLLGMLDRAMDGTRQYVHERHQFGQPLAAFQGVQFQLTDAEVERVGLEELAKYALWSRRLDDALALRLAAIEAADVVLRITHQLHGAVGFCDETTQSWVSRYSLPLRRLPLGLTATRAALVETIGRRGLDGLYTGAFT
jgi:hypothetical protein